MTTPEKREEVALCGDPTCESAGCRQSALDAYYEREQETARVFVRSALGLPS